MYYEDDQMATPGDAMREYARNVGEDMPERAWILTDWDVWMPNPHYQGPPCPHPEDYSPEDDELSEDQKEMIECEVKVERPVVQPPSDEEIPF